MLLYLLSSEELRELLDRLDYNFSGDQIPKMVDYYIARTSHGSTLSGVVHTWVLARSNRSRAMEFFQQVLKSDVADIQGGTTSEGDSPRRHGWKRRPRPALLHRLGNPG